MKHKFFLSGAFVIMTGFVGWVSAFSANGSSAALPEPCKVFFDVDSIGSLSYLINAARWGEHRAYEFLSDFYRTGRGVEKSYINARACLECAGIDLDKLKSEDKSRNPFDPLWLVADIVDLAVADDTAKVMSLLPELAKSDQNLAVFVGRLINCRTAKDIEALISDSLSADEMFIAMGCKGKVARTATDKEISHRQILALASKVPLMYDKLACSIWRKESGDNIPSDETLTQVVDLLNNADSAGFLTANGAALLLNIYNGQVLPQLGTLSAGRAHRLGVIIYNSNRADNERINEDSEPVDTMTVVEVVD